MLHKRFLPSRDDNRRNTGKYKCREERTAQEETRDQESPKRMLSLEAGQRQEVEQSKLLLLTRLMIQSRVWIAYFNLSAEQGFMDAASALGYRLLSHSGGKAEHQQMRLPKDCLCLTGKAGASCVLRKPHFSLLESEKSGQDSLLCSCSPHQDSP